jgi:sulfite reductase alpha subunit-like flavoprotein
MIVKNLALYLILSFLTWTPGFSQQKAAKPGNNSVTKGTIPAKNEYQQEAEAKLKELDREIDGLKTKAATQSEEAKKQFAKQMKELDRKREIARRKLDMFEESSEEAWQDMKPGINRAMKDLEAAYQRAASHFK